MSSKPTSYCVVFLLAGLISSACGSSNPAGPSDTPGSTATSNLAPGRTGSVTVTVNPNPVPFDGKPITDLGSDCAQRNNTWYYEIVLRETGGSPVTFTSRVDAFDGFVRNNLTGISVSVPANGEVKLQTRWCSATSSKHTAQHTFTRTDSNGNPVSVQSELVNLMANTGK